MNRADPVLAPEPGLLAPRVLVPFPDSLYRLGIDMVCHPRTSSALFPAVGSVTYRFTVATIGMFSLTAIMQQPLKIDAQMMRWTILLGLLQFCFNFNFVYAAEHHITSGLVAVIFALLIVPNALLAKYWLGRHIGWPFIIGSAIAGAGVGLLMLQEYRAAPVGGDAVLLGLSLALCGVISASVSNVMQVVPKVARFPTVTILAYSMLWETALNALLAFAMSGPPIIDPRPAYLGGVLYRNHWFGLDLPLYFNLIRDIGPGKAAYTGVLTPIIAMLISTLFEGYHWSGVAIAGAVLAMVGLVVALQTRKA